LKDTRQISSVQTAERGSLVTIVKSVSQNGKLISPLLLFPRKYMKPELKKCTPPGSISGVPSLLVDKERDINPEVSSFHQTYKAD